MAKPILVTLTAPSNSGKSYLLNHIRDIERLPCLISTTTRPARKGEVEGVDYFFITEEESRAIEARDGFAELMTYNGYRYGVSKEEFHGKLAKGVAFLIVEPSGINHYVAPALEVGALHLNCYVDAPEELRIQRMRKRLTDDVMVICDRVGPLNEEDLLKAMNTHVTRLITMLTTERDWKTLHNWNLVLDGTDHPERNVFLIMEAVGKLARDSQLNHS
jgi:guanylate kinase